MINKPIINDAQKKVRRRKSETINLKHLSVQELYDKASSAYETQVKHQDKWGGIISKAGTFKDKIAMTVSQIIKNPQASLKYFQLLGDWACENNHHFALSAVKTMADLYAQHIFPEKPSLCTFFQSVQGRIKQTKKDANVQLVDLVGFYLEDQIKQYYGQLIRAIQALLSSSIAFVKKTAIQILVMLSQFSELRRTIISLCINKFGDSKIINTLSQQLRNALHSNMSLVVIVLEEAERLIKRPRVSQKTLFYMINFLCGLNLKYFDEKCMTMSFGLFYQLFTKAMQNEAINDAQSSKKGGNNNNDVQSSKLFLNSIKGLNKILQFTRQSQNSTIRCIEEKLDQVYKTIHITTNTKAKIQLMLFLFQSHACINGGLTDRFYRMLYSFLSGPDLLHCSLTEVFFDMLLLSLKQDHCTKRILAFFKRLLQLCFSAQSNFVAICLLAVSKTLQSNQSLHTLIKQRENSMESTSEGYDMLKREPMYCGAEQSCLWQIIAFQSHYHPTVRKFAGHIVRGEPIPEAGKNLLLELGTTCFIEKMGLRKERKSEGWKIKNKSRLSYMRSSKYQTLLDKPQQAFQEDQQFIAKYLQQRAAFHGPRRASPKDIEDFADQVIEKQMNRLNPDQEGYSFSDNQPQDSMDQDLEDSQQLEPQEESSSVEKNSKDFQELFQELGSEEELAKKSKKIKKHPSQKNKRFGSRGSRGSRGRRR